MVEGNINSNMFSAELITVNYKWTGEVNWQFLWKMSHSICTWNLQIKQVLMQQSAQNKKRVSEK